MNSLRNRYREYQEPKPKVVIMVNDKAACNLNCACCYLPYEGVREPLAVLRIIDNLQAQYRIAIAGSETLTDLCYLEAYRGVGQKYILTNGLVLDKQPELFDTLREYGIEEIQISYDFKGQKGGQGNNSSMVERVVRVANSTGFWDSIACIVKSEKYHVVGQIGGSITARGAQDHC